MMDMCPTELEKHIMLNSDTFDACQEAEVTITDLLEQTRHKSGPLEIGEYRGEVHGEGRAKGKGKVKRKMKVKAPAKECGKSANQLGGQGPQHGAWGDEDPDYFPYNHHNWGETGHGALHGAKAKGDTEATRVSTEWTRRQLGRPSPRTRRLGPVCV